MSIDIHTAIVIARPCAEVAAFAGDPGNAPRWYVNIKSVEWQTEPPLRTGSRMAFVAHFLGKRLAYTYEVTELVPGQRLVMRTADGPFPMATIYTWTSLPDGGTQMTLQNRGEPRGFGRLGAPLIAVAMRRAMEKDLRKLKELLEQRLV